MRKTIYEGMTIESDIIGKCIVCGSDTKYVDLSLETYVCSYECEVKLEQDYAKACQEIKLSSSFNFLFEDKNKEYDDEYKDFI